ncbi:MAG: long-chain acyl-CoA synthetase [Candidatus Marinimicrobia bacterium]|nr:long-chain acyl-CoA synthetase [Candidatus Neomarinimicrobiota bacterium]
MKFKTVSELFKNTVNEHSSKELYYYKKGSDWSSINGKTILYTVTDITNALISKSVSKNTKVGILSTNSPKWAMIDYGIICSGSATVSIYPTLIPSQISYIVNDSGLKALFLENEDQLAKINEIWEDCTSLEFVVMMNDSFESETDKIIKFSTFLDIGMKYGNENPKSFEKSCSSITESDLLTLIYTSGTTGTPKGVMLTHGNLTSNIKATLEAQQFERNEIFLSFLPLSHVFERMCGHFCAFAIGATTYYAENMESVVDNMKIARPTRLISVPRLYEKIHAKIITGIERAPKLKKIIFFWALSVGKKVSSLKYSNKSVNVFLNIKYKIAEKLIFDKVKNTFGGRLKNFISGGAPLSIKLADFFQSLGLLIVEGYGLTETSPIITANTAKNYKFGTVGMPLSNVEVKIAEDGEILAKGPNVMKGYYNKVEETNLVIDVDGWFHTGDIGKIDDDGYLKITDRKKSLIVTSGGKNIAPAPLENSILNSIYVEQCLVIGDGKNFISALIVPNYESLKDYLKSNNIDLNSREAMIEHKSVLKLFDKEISESMINFSKFERVKKYKLLTDLWTLENEEITPSMKVVRKKVISNYSNIIEEIYND